jgi:hypothetical protein
MPNAEEMKRLAMNKNRYSEDTEANDALSLLVDVGAMFAIERYVGDEPPPPYSDLLKIFADRTQGAFVPVGIVEKYLVPNRDPERRETFPVAVEFVAAKKLISFKGRALGRKYDLEAAHAAANRALELAGKNERFFAIELDDQEMSYVFGLPEAWKQIAADYSLPLSESPLLRKDD